MDAFICLSSSFPLSHSHMSLSVEMKHESVGNYSQLDDCISLGLQAKLLGVCEYTESLFTN